ncbi:D-alanyl-D-alanine carboxypeptidase/D-alanyl-D-alanine endopeptidase [Prevotella bivia]|jgi:D-alanyl-D-alanine carboxypeptidase/D-alanyl-D-alanine-endopeptidase (penicillin-binding protein 4)|uniref:D-alanyl-D-alanine carboxypeptidase/D-alanyl-D-alanine endopeptidase n=1 Tax=Prevotella bivia TaxID=28125 RepID=UPI00254CE3D8|nr:D-alanyl-D-alanine carboxypeptidase/D-alanyl-D-alanine-endopeptidase [Prevotella bivia]MDZ3818350.1 D-alanyl-D-alanine carboxypeptidase/D-alanyl-D-alanine-endopeptidase [Prevotella bivia]
MKIKQITTLLLFTFLSLPLAAQVYLDSAEVARFLPYKNKVVTTTQNALEQDSISSDDETDDEVDSTLTAFDYDTHLSWKENITQRLNNIFQSPLLQTVQAGVMIWDLTDDTLLFQHNEQLHLRPASTMKCVTAIAALDKLGSSYTYKTSLYYTGNLVDSTQTLEGDLYIVGGMDPMFRATEMNQLVAAIKNLGINHITGTLYADLSFKDSKQFGRGWCWDDKNPTLTPLLYNKKDIFIEQFNQKLRQNGITIDSGYGTRQYPSNAQNIITTTHSIGDVMHHMMKASDNLYAESMFYQLASNGGINKHASANNARIYIQQLIRKLGLNPSNYKIADGSGLSLYNYLTAELEVKLLRYAYQNPDIYNTLLPTLPIAGVDGTLRKRMRNTPAARNVKAKTGTVVGVTSLAGYLTAANGHLICFSIINNGGLASGAMRNFQNRICIALCQ